MHGVIKDPGLQKQIRMMMEERNCTFEQILKSEIDFKKDPDNDLYLRFQEIECSIIRRYKKENLRILMDLFWSYTILAAKGIYDLEKLLNDVNAGFLNDTYKNMEFIEKKSLIPSEQGSFRDFYRYWEEKISEIPSAKKNENKE